MTAACAAVSVAVLVHLRWPDRDGWAPRDPPAQVHRPSSAIEPPSFRDPALPLQAQGSAHPIASTLRQALASYRRRWGSLPHVPVHAAALRPGMRGLEVAALRQRLGLPGGDAYDPDLVEAVRVFQTAHGLMPDGSADGQTIAALNAGPGFFERIIRLNIARAEALPAASDRFVLVNIAAARLWMYQQGRPVGSMAVVVGKPTMQTPTLYGLIRHAVLNPYWNVPPDLVRHRAAPGALRDGPEFIETHRYELWSDFSSAARPLEAEAVDWRGVEHGSIRVRVRQKPGDGNMMGKVKFMSPNPLGIYLHDTPNKQLFRKANRRLSAGCVRVADAQRLSRWLFGGTAPAAAGGDVHVDLPSPVPVYMVYLTAYPDGDAIRFTGDPYGWDARALVRSGTVPPPSWKVISAPRDHDQFRARAG